MVIRDRNYLTIPASRFFNRFVFSPLRSYLVIVLYELGFTPYEIGITVAIADIAALVGSALGPFVADFIGRKNSSALGRFLSVIGLTVMYFTYPHKLRLIVSIFIMQVGLLRGRSSSYVLAGETTTSRVSFGSWGLAINNIGGLLGLYVFVNALDSRLAAEVFKEITPLWILFASLSALAIFLSRETLQARPRGVKSKIKIEGKFLKYLIVVTFTFFGIAIYRTFSSLYAKNYVGVSDSFRGIITMVSTAIETSIYLINVKLSPSASRGILTAGLAFSLMTIIVVIYPVKMAALIGFGMLAPVFNAHLWPSLMDFDISLTDDENRGVYVSIIFVARRIGLINGRILGSRLFVSDPRLVMIVPAIVILLGASIIRKIASK